MDATAFCDPQRLRGRNTICCMSIWWDYITRISGTGQQKRMSDDTGISQTAFSRWKKEQNKPEAPHVIAFARAYGRPPVEALVAAGILDAGDAADVIEVHTGLTALTDAELITEIQQRMEGLRHALEIAKEQAASSKAPSHEKTDDEDRSADNSQSRTAFDDLDAATDGAISELDVDGVDDDGQQFG